MKCVTVTTVAFALALVLAPLLPACPMCQEAAGASQTGQDDAFFQARAFNHAIYLMVSMPYLLLGGLGFLFYRSVKRARNEALTVQANPETRIALSSSQFCQAYDNEVANHSASSVSASRPQRSDM